MEKKVTLHEWKKESIVSGNNHFFRALSQIYISIAVLDVDSGTGVVLSSRNDGDIVGCEMPWDTLLDRYVCRRVYEEDKERIYSMFSLASLSLFSNSGMKEKNIEVRCLLDTSGVYDWVEVNSSIFDASTRQLLITTRNISEMKMQKRVLDKFLYHQNCDFFILVNMAENNYEYFDVSTGLLPVPEMGCTDYMEDMIRFNSRYVVKSEADKVISLMSLDTMRDILADKEEYSFTSGIITDSGEYRRARMQLISFDRTKQQVIITRSDITQVYLEEKQRNEQMLNAMREAQRDMLTGLYNQTATEKIVTQILTGYQGELAAVMFIDVDNFKMVNDTLGHLQGNEVLKGMADFLKGFLTKDCIAGRVGGDEFLLFLSNIVSIQEVCETGRLICGALEGIRDLIAELPISCSVGISLYPQDGIDYEQLVRKADQALYRSKRYGKNTYSLYSEEMGSSRYSSAISEIDASKCRGSYAFGEDS